LSLFFGVDEEDEGESVKATGMAAAGKGEAVVGMDLPFDEVREGGAGLPFVTLGEAVAEEEEEAVGGGGKAAVELIAGTGAFGADPSAGANSLRNRIIASTRGYSPARSAGRSCEMREKRL
jgi:hypothetical protein